MPPSARGTSSLNKLASAKALTSAGGSRRFVAADQVASLHEHGVDLRIDAAAVAGLPEPHGGAGVWRDRDPGVKPSRWKHIVDLMSGANPRGRDWTEEK